MGQVTATGPLGQFAAAFPSLGAFDVQSATATEIVLGVSDDTTLTLRGEDFHYAPDGHPLGGTVTGLEMTDGDQPVFVATDFDLSLGAMLGFVADNRFQDLAAYIFDQDDHQDGSESADLMAGFHGEDTLHGNGGNDTIDAGDGEDDIGGGAGSDLVFARAGADLVFGDGDDDVLFGNTGLDTLAGGDGDDTIYGGQDYDVLEGDAGDDLLYGDLGGDDLWGGAGNDTLIGGGGEFDWFFFTSGGGQDQVDDFDIAGGDQLQIETNINDTDIVDFASLEGRISSDGDGGTIIDLGAGDSIHLVGVDAEAVDASYFAFFPKGAVTPITEEPLAL